MRLDIFLSDSRLIKRRTLAKKACEDGRVYVDGQRAKASKNIRAGQRIEIDFFSKSLEVEVLDIPKGNVKKQEAINLYKVLKEKTKRTGFL
ncbi:MAG: hypothetical protein AMJ90_01685 [candidate division Zixibacteria bacterium SM23_73_2]|nr:MAG: hypothetical protein AMJ90_01685 [candidate division Zixibacteria bacterium SM23_73_2]